MKIAIACNHAFPGVGGSEYVIKHISDYLIKNNHEVCIFARKNKNRTKYKTDIKFSEYIPGDFKHFYSRLTTYKPDLTFIYSDVFDYFRNLITTRNPFRLIVALCGANWIYSQNSQNLFYQNLHNIERIVCHSTHERDYQLCSVDPFLKKTVIIPNGIDISEFDNSKLTRQDLLPQHEEKQWILNVSNFFPGKNQKYIIPILNNLPQNKEYVYVQINSDIDFQIGQQLEDEWKKITTTKLNKNIHLVHKKNVSREHVVAFIKQSNAFILPSNKEVAPISIVECMAASLPWVSMDVGNVRDLKGGKYIPAIKDSKYNSILDDRVSRVFSNYLQELLMMPVIAEQGRKQIERELNWNKILPMYENIFEKK